MEIDIREFRLKKWYMPKTKSSLSVDDTNYHAVGYFDIIDVQKAVYEEEACFHPWSTSYQNSHRTTGELQSDYFVQEIKAFVNISEDGKNGFTKKQLEEFWNNTDFLLCMSMIHIVDEVEVQKVLEHIKTIMNGVTYLYYFTYDYSGIIIVAKDICIKEYLEHMFSLNYANDNHEKLIKDTFSIYGFRKEILYQISVDETGELKEKILHKDSQKYEVAINISIRDYAKYLQWKTELNCFEQNSGYVSCEMQLAGRHDVSIVNKEADLYWMLKVQCLLDRYTNSRESAFYAYETFVKTEKRKSHIDNWALNDALYQKAAKELDELYKEFSILARDTGHQSYITPVREVCNSVLSILKNGFAEDFVVCMYQPFKEFLGYLLKNLKDNRKTEMLDYEREFDRCFCAFFDGLNSLINSAMHTDRQFIQSTSFGAIFYDIPPKIMAFYVVMIQKICRVMRKNDEHNYTFFMTPGFSDEIYVRIISYRKKKAEDRILQVFINESFLYHPEAVMRRMVHEIAHFEGDGLRNRELRKEKMIKTYVHEILRRSVPSILGEYSKLTEDFVNILISQDEFSYKKDNYSKDNDHLYERILVAITEYGAFEEALKNHLERSLPKFDSPAAKKYFRRLLCLEITEDVLCNAGIREKDMDAGRISEFQKKILIELLTDEIFGKISTFIKNKSRNYNEDMWKFARSLMALYSETYADMQMILVLDYSYEAYLKGFLIDEKLSYKDILERNEDISRISVIAKLMKQQGKWPCEITWEQESEQGKSLTEFHEKIWQFIGKMSDSKDIYYIQNKYLEEYLTKCYDESLEYYEHFEYPLFFRVKDELIKIREEIQVVVEHKDVFQVFDTINKVISEYKKNM